jgi:hypothetical protein
LDSLTEYGPITNISKSEKEDANWIVVTFLNPQSTEKALSLDGKMFDNSWILIVRTGDCFGVLDKVSPKKESVQVKPEMAFKKTRLVLSEQALVTPVQQKVTRFAQLEVEESIPIRTFHESVIESKMYPDVVMEEDVPPISNDFYIAPAQEMNVIATSAEPAVRPTGILSKISDFLFGW